MASLVGTFFKDPPEAGTVAIPKFGMETTMTSLGVQVPPKNAVIWQISTGTPPSAVAFLSFPWLKKATQSPFGEKNGNNAPSDSGIVTDSNWSRRRTKRCDTPPSAATYATRLPSGESATACVTSAASSCLGGNVMVNRATPES